MKFLKYIAIALFVLLSLLVGLYLVWVISPVPERLQLVLDNYFSARTLFRKRAQEAGAKIETFSIAAQGANGEELTLDTAWLGEVPKILPNLKIGWTLQEFGAYGPVTTLRALMNENRYHHRGSRALSLE